jgi:hypothetical protein
MTTELTNWGFLGFGICGGFIFGLYYYDKLVAVNIKARMKAAIDGLNDALCTLGISKDENDNWIMRPKDRDEIWIKKEEG